jgi:pSer/pThr/pTyr-binding forkhead associated (FHA) protein
MDDTTGPVTDAAAYLLVPISGGPGSRLSDRVVIGRMNTCDISIQDKSVSREHARLSRLGSGYLLEDLHSTNGTLVNGNRITEATVIQPGDLLTFGTVEFRLESEGPPAGWQAEEVANAAYLGADDSVSPSFAETDEQGDASSAAAIPAGMTTAAPAMQPEEAPSPLVVRRTGPQTLENGPAPALLADEIVGLAGRLSELVQRLAESAAIEERDAPVRENLATIRDIVDSVPASPMTPEEVQGAHEVLTGLAGNPKDFDLLMRTRDIAPQLARILNQYAQLEAVLTAVADAVERSSAG